MPILTARQRNFLEAACTKGRRASEQAVRASLTSLAVTAERPPTHLNENDRELRRGLRAKARQLGDVGDKLDLLVAECAYEQWHRLLFARFLSENNLLIHPEYQAPVTLEDCDELAASLGEPDGWSVAALFAAEIVPGIFRLEDPCVQLRLAPEGRLALESIVADIPAEVFAGDDALGWVYQFWQKDKKEEVNASERKIGGADIGPVTQLFTENYMVRFLLENSLGAWWASRHPNSPLLKDFEYLRFNDAGKPAAGTFDSWPDNVSDVTVMDPSCGSGHFLVEAFAILWRMRAEDDGLAPVDAQDAVLRENLFGLELDPRCVQIAIFALALHAWKSSGEWREIPVPNVACSGIPVNAPAEEWRALANGDQRLEDALARLHILFREADTLGSLIDPRRSAEISDPTGTQISLEDVDWDELLPSAQHALTMEGRDPAASVLAADVSGLWRSAELLTRSFTLVATNVPFLSRGKQSQVLRTYCDSHLAEGRGDLATAMLLRWARVATVALVTPQNWQEKSTYEDLRQWVLRSCSYKLFARIGNNVWQTQSSGQPFKMPTVLSVIERQEPHDGATTSVIDIGNGSLATKARDLAKSDVTAFAQSAQQSNPESRILPVPVAPSSVLLGSIARCIQGTSTGDTPRYVRKFWELPHVEAPWHRFQSSTAITAPYVGRESVVRWDGPGGVADEPGSAVRGDEAWGHLGVSVTQMGNLSRTLYLGDRFDTNAAAVVPHDAELVPALWAFCTSNQFVATVRSVASSTQVTNGALELVPFDVDHWRKVAAENGQLPEENSQDPTQWLFRGRPDASTAPLHVAIARLLGYRWPEQFESDELNTFTDADGIVCLPSVTGEPPAAERLQQLLATAFGESWSSAKRKDLLELSGSKKDKLDDWLRDECFKQHCALFGHRPFVWHIWDGQRDGFAALVNYHRLDRKVLEKLTYTYLGDWIERQRAEVRDEVIGAEARLAAASKLRKSLELILDGEPPYDIYVRWKSLAEQPIGWEPDLNDGVRVNVRPFVEAGILRSQFNVHWRKDRGKNPDGSERLNNCHLTTAEKRASRGGSA
ncbi:hypothetical protein A5707_03920 [Mycobacterium kyorinense]|uniref:site-specific DNA-methyltransferase (adenine-specific) n=1 Tax=Mycobacterium kyorinense TaxID=487514 RepID=A0A1A2Z430_9MYCO|nr:DNA methyltransferase [Mycobacterium kyorinense]OBI43926.1 hypothetical protein A5707_03920 [Mycobacterium kyorinense]